MPKVLISDQMDPKAAEIFRAHGVEVDERPGLSKDELKAIIGDYDGLAIRSATKVTADLLEAATRLKVVGRAGIGVDNVDIPAASARGVVVMNTPVRQFHHHRRACGRLDVRARPRAAAGRRLHPGRQVGEEPLHGGGAHHKVLGLIGAGNIGSIVADRRSARMKVIAFDPSSRPSAPIDRRRTGRLDELLARADFITLHTPLTDQTRNILSREALPAPSRGADRQLRSAAA
jgi:D-3-phosphoglycerate dehydrogenase